MVRGFVDVDVERESEGIKSDPLTRPALIRTQFPCMMQLSTPDCRQVWRREDPSTEHCVGVHGCFI